MNAKQTALDAYLARSAAIHAKLERLQQFADDYFGHDSHVIDWGHVGNLGRVEVGLGEVLAIFIRQPLPDDWEERRQVMAGLCR